jgi:choline-sulfatase
LWHLLRPHEPSLFRYLKNAGYDIQWFGKNDLYSQEYLDEICDDIGEKREGYRTKPSRKHGHVHSRINPYTPKDPEYYSFLFSPVEDDGAEIPLDEDIARAIDYLRNWKEGDKPFMLFLPITMPHTPYDALERFHNMYDPELLKDQLVRPEETFGKPSYVELIRKYRRLDQLAPEFMNRIYATYLGMNSYVDYLLGELMKTMEERRLFDSTTLIASSDHGDWSGNYGLVEKWPNAMEDLLLKVPLLIRAPKNKAGHVVGGQVELFDIMATVMELADIKAGHTHFAKSLVPQLEGQAGDTGRFVFAEGGYDTQDERCFECVPRANRLMDKDNIYYPKAIQQMEYPQSVCRTTMVRSLTHKLVLRTSGENELYDLVKDSNECINLYNDESCSAIKVELQDQMLRWYIKTADTVPLYDDYRGFSTTGM